MGSLDRIDESIKLFVGCVGVLDFQGGIQELLCCLGAVAVFKIGVRAQLEVYMDSPWALISSGGGRSLASPVPGRAIANIGPKNLNALGFILGDLWWCLPLRADQSVTCIHR